MDTKQLIEEARKLAEQQKEQELVKEALEVLAADPALSTNVTPQQFLDRLVAVVKKVDERSTTKDTSLHTTITTETDTKLALKADATSLATKQDTLTKTITLTFDDNTTEVIKVG